MLMMLFCVGMLELRVTIYTCGAGDSNEAGIFYEILRSWLNLKGMCSLVARFFVVLVI